MPFENYPLRHKLVLVIMMTSVIALAVACAGFFGFALADQRARMQRQLTQRADIIGLNSTATLTFDDPNAAVETLATMRVDPHFAAARLYDKDGREFATYARPGQGASLPAAPGPDGVRFARGRITAVRGVTLGGERIGTVFVSDDLGELSRAVTVLLAVSFVVLLVASAAALGLAARFQRLVSRPILELTGAALAITLKGDYSPRVPKSSGDELGVLVEAFNAMLDRVEERDRSLRESRQRLASLVETTPVGVIVWDEAVNVMEWNRAAERIFGYSAKEALGRHATFIVPHAVWDTQIKGIADDLLAGKGPSIVGNPNVTKDGRTIFCEWHNAPLRDAAGRVFAVASIVEDISERQRAEREIRRLNEDLERRVRERTAKLEAANKELEAFSYSVSHDLRAPLRSIDGFSLAVMEDYGKCLDDRGQSHLRRIRNAAQRMAAIIDDMLTLGRVTRSELRRERVDLGALAREIVAELADKQPGRKAAVEIDPGAEVWGDAQLLRLMLENLLGNAWKFTSKTPEARIEFRVMKSAGRTTFVVRDNGAGFDPTYAGKLFQPFVRLHSANEFPGTGVGLAIVTRVIERHGGRIWAEGSVGKGAAFHFTLGRAEGREEAS